MVSHCEDGALIEELFTHRGSGTQITEHSAERLRPAQLDDVGRLMELTAPPERAGVLLPRTRERIEREIAHFWVLELDGLLTACAAPLPTRAAERSPAWLPTGSTKARIGRNGCCAT